MLHLDESLPEFGADDERRLLGLFSLGLVLLLLAGWIDLGVPELVEHLEEQLETGVAEAGAGEILQAGRDGSQRIRAESGQQQRALVLWEG